jgi:hypothetical protein
MHAQPNAISPSPLCKPYCDLETKCITWTGAWRQNGSVPALWGGPDQHQPGTQRPTHPSIPLLPLFLSYISAFNFGSSSACSSGIKFPAHCSGVLRLPVPFHPTDRLTLAWLDATSRAKPIIDGAYRRREEAQGVSVVHSRKSKMLPGRGRRRVHTMCEARQNLCC